MSGDRRCRRCHFGTRDEALLSFTKPSAHRSPPLLMIEARRLLLPAWRLRASGCFRAVSRPARLKIASQSRMTRRIQPSNFHDRKRSNPAAALSQTHFASERFQADFALGCRRRSHPRNAPLVELSPNQVANRVHLVSFRPRAGWGDLISLEPADGAVGYVIGPCNVDQGLAGFPPCHGFLALVMR